MKSIKLAELPRTFRDAVLVTRMMGIRFLWIDSLCIIQDNNSDWQAESARMADVFMNADITLAASAATNSDEGFIPSRETTLQVRGLEDNSGEGSATTRHSGDAEATYFRRATDEERSLSSSPLFQRGWVLQETLLSRRTIHFAKDQLFWQCRERLASEDGSLDGLWTKTQFHLDTLTKADESWWTWVEDYSKRHLTKPSDKLAAIAGLTKVVAQVNGNGEPLAGLWSHDIHFGLMWTVSGHSRWAQSGIPPDNTRRSPVAGLPSWSWVSMDSPVQAAFERKLENWRDHSHGVRGRAEFIGSTIQWSGEPLTSTLLSAKLHLRTKVITAALFSGGKLGTPISERGNSDSVFFGGRYYLDLSMADASGTEVLCMYVSTGCRCESGSHVENPCRDTVDLFHYVLLIEATDQSCDEYRRLGVGEIDTGLNSRLYPTQDCFEGVDMKVFTLV
jgi:hypothetical protein